MTLLFIIYPIAALTADLIIDLEFIAEMIWLIWRGICPELHECLHCLCSRDSKDDAKSQAEKDLEEIKKIVEDSGGKLSNRSLQCEVRVQDQIGWIVFLYIPQMKGHFSLGLFFFLWAAGVWEEEVWWFNYSGHSEPRRPERWRFVTIRVQENKQMFDMCTIQVYTSSCFHVRSRILPSQIGHDGR